MFAPRRRLQSGGAVAEFRRTQPNEQDAAGRVGFGHGFEALFARAQEEGELPSDIDAPEMAQMLQALVMDSILDWSGGHSDLGRVVAGPHRPPGRGAHAEPAQSA